MHRPDGAADQGFVSLAVKEVVTMRARDIMHWNPTVVTPDEGVSHAAEHMRYEHDACIPVVKDEERRELVGVITARDLATRCLARCHGLTCTVRDHMTPLPLHTVQLDDDVGTMLQVMHDAEIRRLPVVSPEGILLGVVTEAAITEALTLTDWLAHSKARTPNGTPRKRSLVS
jgi:CBS domain-containing protein